MALLYGRAGRLTAQNGGFRPGQNPAVGEVRQVTAANIIDHPDYNRATLQVLRAASFTIRFLTVVRY